MQKTSNLLWFGIAGIVALVCFGGVDANAAGRSMVGGAGRAAPARMPTMPTMSLNTIGTHAVSGVDVDYDNGGNGGNGGGNGGGTEPDEPTTDCADGGVANSDFTVNDCMQSILTCVQSGALPNGLADLFNEDLRNSIINGMGICAADIDRCIREVRIDCHNVYNSSVDVWLDFNSRIVQPEYYNFVLRKTGLTPNQAENVCELLDKNTYGKSFAAVSYTDDVTSEYNDKIGAYNNQEGGTLSKANPQGPTVNTTANGNRGVDGERGHYARWDATNGVCKIRVAAYNKDTLITNDWLFGGDKTAAEVWQDAGSTFTCNKDLFDFSLLNTTKDVAVIGMGGGTLLGAGVGALAGHGDRAFDCSNGSSRDALASQLNTNTVKELNQYFPGDKTISATDVSEEDCEAVYDLYKAYVRTKKLRDVCVDEKLVCSVTVDSKKHDLTCADINSKNVKLDDNKLTASGINWIDKLGITLTGDTNALAQCIQMCKGKGDTVRPCKFKSLKGGFATEAFYGSGSDALVAEYEKDFCNGQATDCVEMSVINTQISELDGIFNKLSALKGEEGNRLKTTLAGAGIGLGAGGVATAITAFVERNNISCRVGDGLNVVGFGKSFTIDSLKDFYVKWDLRVADSISPTARVVSCQDWIDTCGMYTTATDCNNVAINYQQPGRNTTNLVRNACVMSGSVCIENRSVAVSYGACDPDPTRVVVPSVTNSADVYLIEH